MIALLWIFRYSMGIRIVDNAHNHRNTSCHCDKLVFVGLRRVDSGQWTVDSGQLRSPFGTNKNYYVQKSQPFPKNQTVSDSLF